MTRSLVALVVVSRALKLVASLVAVAAAVLWLGFFVEHVTEWFSGSPAPPPGVWVAQLAHLGILVGLIASLRWRLVGSITTVVSALLFFALTVWPPVPLPDDRAGSVVSGRLGGEGPRKC